MPLRQRQEVQEVLRIAHSGWRWGDQVPLVACRTQTGRVRDNLPKIYSRELIDEIFTQPYCRIDNLVQKGIAKRQTASRYLRLLAEIGVLEERKIGREKPFVNPELLSLLTDDGEAQ
jgi:hypothetical protein